MVLPVNVDTCTVVGAFVKLDGTPASGTVTFTPVPARLLDATADPPTTILGTPIVATLDEGGAVTVDLPATDDADLNPVDWAYHVSIRLGDYAAYSFCMTAAAGMTVDLAVVTPIYGDSGDVIVAGPPGQGVPVGGEAGEVLTKASGDDFDTDWLAAPPPGAHAASHAAASTDPVTLTEAQVTGLVADLAAKQPLDADLTAIAALAPGSDAVIQRKVGMWVASTPTEYKDDLDLSKADVGFGNVTNTSDAAKPVSTAQQTALDLKADKTTTFTPTAPLTGGGSLAANRTLGVSTFSDVASGVVPLSGGGTANFLRADGSWAAPPGAFAGVGNTATFSYNTTTTEPPTGNQLRLNSATFTAATRLWVMQTTVDGLDVSIGLARILAGHQIYFQDRDDASHWVKYNVTADGVDDGAYYDFTVAYHSGPGAIPAGQVELQAIAPGTVGVPPGGSDGQVLAKTSSGDYAVAWESLTKTDVGLSNVDNTADTAKPVSTATQTALDLKTDKSVTINAQTGTTYTLVLGDAGKLVTLTNASAITLTVPINSSVAYPTGTRIDLAQLGAGQVTVSQTGGVTVNATPTKKLRAQYAAASLVKYATDTWLLVGDLAAT